MQINFAKKYATAPAITVTLDTAEIGEARLTAIYEPASREIDGDRAQIICYKSDSSRLASTSVTARWVAVGEAADPADNNVGGSGGGGGDAGPHDHDYLPLEGGTLTGDLRANENLRVDGIIHAVGTKDNERDAPANVHINASGYLYKTTVGSLPLSGGTLTGDLQVDGELTFSRGLNNSRIYHNPAADRSVLVVRSSDDDDSARLVLYGGNDISQYAGSARLMIGDTIAAEWHKNGNVFHLSEGVDTADVLDRAETATMPAPEEAGVDGLTVNEVVTALLLKVKELSAEIKELKGN
jgi:hypothetical protein